MSTQPAAHADATHPDTVYHFVDPADWAQAQSAGAYAPEALRRDGFLHCATRAQLAGVVERHQRGRGALVLLHLDAAALGEALRYDLSPRSGEAYPHVYGPIALSAVRTAEPFQAPA
jgi:glutathione S-transferase